jgi:hypothetical protein
MLYVESRAINYDTMDNGLIYFLITVFFILLELVLGFVDKKSIVSGIWSF